jgi:hypothetical protein
LRCAQVRDDFLRSATRNQTVSCLYPVSGRDAFDEKGVGGSAKKLLPRPVSEDRSRGVAMICRASVGKHVKLSASCNS